MLSSKLYYFLCFITCGLKEAFGLQNHEHETRVQQLDTIAVEDEEIRRKPQCMSHSEGPRQKRYDVNGVRNRGIKYWFRRKKIAPAVLPSARQGPSRASCARGLCPIIEISEGQPDETSNDHIVLAFSETKDSLLQKQTSAQALQSFASCARLNENFMRKTTRMGVDNCVNDDNTTNTQEIAFNSSFSSKIIATWKAFRQRISFRGTQTTPDNAPCCRNENESEARKNLAGNIDVERKLQGVNSGKCCRRKSVKNSSTTNKKEPVGSHRPGESDPIFNRDLYMQVNNVVVTRASSQYTSSDPFLFPEETSTLSGLPLEYLYWRTNGKCDSQPTKRKSRLPGVLRKFKRKGKK